MGEDTRYINRKTVDNLQNVDRIRIKLWRTLVLPVDNVDNLVDYWENPPIAPM
jgi:hypothetical protein